MKADSVYGFAKDKDVEAAILARLEFILEDDTFAIKAMLGEAVTALLEINNAIPVQSRQRHLVAQPLEQFADGDATD